MKLRVLILVGSLALNTALLAALVSRPSLAPPAVRDFFQRDSGRTVADAAKRTGSSGGARPQRLAVADPAAVWSSLHATDLATFVARLRAAGFPPTMVRAIIDAEIERQFSPRLKELMRTVNETPFWKPDPGYYAGNSKLFEEINQIYRERSRAVRELLGKDAFAWGGGDPNAAQRRQFGNLSQAKIDLVQRINDDYAEMTSQIRAAMQGITLPEDREKIALLEREKRADLAAVLSPQELADYEMRTSPVTSRLRTALTILDSSEAEFRTIYMAHNEQKDTLYPTSTGGMIVYTPDIMEKRRQAGEQVQQQLRTALGNERFAEYQRASDSDFQQLYRLGQRDNVPYATLVRAHEVRHATNEAATKLYADPALTPAAKLTAVKELVQSARNNLLSTLGPATGPSYIDNSRWLQSLEQGRITTTSPEGMTSTRSLSTTPPRTTPTTATPVPATPAPKK